MSMTISEFINGIATFIKTNEIEGLKEKEAHIRIFNTDGTFVNGFSMGVMQGKYENGDPVPVWMLRVPVRLDQDYSAPMGILEEMAMGYNVELPKLSAETYAILHEIGHICTLDEFLVDGFHFHKDLKRKLNYYRQRVWKAPDDLSLEKLDERSVAHHKLPHEVAADTWVLEKGIHLNGLEELDQLINKFYTSKLRREPTTNQKLSKEIHKFLRANSIEKVHLSYEDEWGFPNTEFGTSYDTNRIGTEITKYRIYIPQIESDFIGTVSLERFLKEKMGWKTFNKMNVNTWFFLQMLGHVFTSAKYYTPRKTRKEHIEKYNEMKKVISSKGKNRKYKDYLPYFEFPSELDATMWMVENHHKLIGLEELNRAFMQYFGEIEI
jgi:hypothetical protein